MPQSTDPAKPHSKKAQGETHSSPYGAEIERILWVLGIGGNGNRKYHGSEEREYREIWLELGALGGGAI